MRNYLDKKLDFIGIQFFAYVKCPENLVIYLDGVKSLQTITRQSCTSPAAA